MSKLLQHNNLRIFTFLILFIAVIFAIVFFLYVTENGVGISTDSTTYIATANSLLEGKGFYKNSVPMTHYPPVYPILLAISGLFSYDIVDSARWLHTIIYSVNAILFGILIFLNTQRKLLAMIVGLVIFFSSPTVLDIHSYALSESPFIMFSFLSFLLIYFYLSTHRWIYLLISSLSLGLAITTRYVGIALLPPVLIIIFSFVNKPFKQRIKEILTILIISLIPVFIWVVRNIITAQTATNRSFIYHPISINKLKDGLFGLIGMFLPSFGSGWISLLEINIISLLFFYIAFVLYKKRGDFSHSQSISVVFISIGFLFVLTYFVVLILSISFFDAATPLDNRILAPAYLILYISVISLIFLYSNVAPNNNVWMVFITFVIVLNLTNISSVIDKAQNFNADGIGYNSILWKESPTIEKLRSMQFDNLIYSNGASIVGFKLEIFVSSIPAYYSSNSTVENENYSEQLFSMCDAVEDGEAIVVFLDGENRSYLPSEEELLAECELPILYDTEDGTIYGVHE